MGSTIDGGVTDAWLARAVVTESAEAIVVTDPDGIIRLWNKERPGSSGFRQPTSLAKALT